VTLRAFFGGSITDAAGRPEPKMLAGLLFLSFDFVYVVLCIALVAKWDVSIFSAVGSIGIALVGATAVTDALLDKSRPSDIEAGPPSPPAGA
jgi:hypothetical protein